MFCCVQDVEAERCTTHNGSSTSHSSGEMLFLISEEMNLAITHIFTV
jgi:hypothetical protein